MFFTDYSMAPGELGQALEAARLRVAVGAGAFAYSCVAHFAFSVGRRAAQAGLRRDGSLRHADRGGGCDEDAEGRHRGLPGAAARSDPDRKAGGLDRSGFGGRFLFGVGSGWNAEEMADHGTAFKSRHKVARERIEAMKVIWTETKARIPRRIREFRSDDDLAEAGPETASAGDRRRCVPVWRAPRDPLRGWLGAACLRPEYGDVSDFLPQFRQMATEAGRDPASLPLTMFRVVEELERLRHYRDIGIARVVITLPSAGADEVLPILDRWAEKIRQMRHDNHARNSSATPKASAAGTTMRSACRCTPAICPAASAAAVRSRDRVRIVEGCHELVASFGRRRGSAELIGQHVRRLICRTATVQRQVRNRDISRRTASSPNMRVNKRAKHVRVTRRDHRAGHADRPVGVVPPLVAPHQIACKVVAEVDPTRRRPCPVRGARCGRSRRACRPAGSPAGRTRGAARRRLQPHAAQHKLRRNRPCRTPAR